MISTHNMQRQGVVLIAAVGLAIILLTVSVSFFTHMRSDSQEAELIVQETQARIMLHAAMNYIQETSRLGWDRPSSTDVMEEAFGWTDVRATDVSASDPSAIGPRDALGVPLYTDTSAFPAPGGRAARCPMYVMRRTPYAVTNKLVHNPINADASFNIDNLRDGSLDYRMANLPVEPVAKNWADFVTGDRSPVMSSVGLAWFRVYREPPEMHDGNRNNFTGPAPDSITDWYDVEAMPGHHGIFIVTCGSGGTLGFKNWQEVTATYPTATDRPFDQATFESLRETERILWYRLEWSAAVVPGSYGIVSERQGRTQFRIPRQRHPDGELQMAPNSPTVHAGVEGSGTFEGGFCSINQVGTIDWIMRLEREPADW